MKYYISLILPSVFICIAICLLAIDIAGKTKNKRWEVISVTGEWSNSGDSSLGKYLAERWTKRHSGSTPNKIQERCNEVVNHYIDVVSNVRKVGVSKTIDTETYVIKFTSAGGKTASLWLDENGEINSISEY